MPAEAGFVVTLSNDTSVATVTLNRPERRNPQSPVTWVWLARIGHDLPGSVRVLVLEGEGSSFSSGMDRAMFSAEGLPGVPNMFEFARMGSAESDTAIAGFQEAFAVFARPDVVSVALIQGHAIGAGFQLALACDLRLAAEDAHFRMAEVTLGLVPDLGGTRRLVELVGYSRAAEICLTGQQFGASAAERMGLVNKVVPAEDLRSAGNALVSQILTLPRTAVTETKALLLRASGRSQEAQERAERQAQYRQLRELAGLEAEDEAECTG